MVRRSLLRLAGLWIALALLLPLAAAADSCSDCLWAPAPNCCPHSSCLCCLQGPSVLTARVLQAEPCRADAGPAGAPAQGGCLSADPGDVFHIPKPSLA